MAITMQKTIIRITCALFILSAVLWGYDWPSEDSEIVYGFGQQDSVRVVQKGVRLSTSNQDINTIESGRIIFQQNSKSYLPSRDAGMVVVAHQDGLYSAYTHISIEEEQVQAGQEMALSYFSGGQWQYELYLYDAKTRQYVNPALFLPLGRSGERVLIEQLVVVDEFGQEYRVYNGAVLPSGVVRFLVSGYAITARGRRLTPTEVSLQVLGNNLSRISFSAITEEEGNAYLVGGNAPIALKSLYNERAMISLAQTRLQEGQLSLVVRLSNLDGRMQESTMRVRVVNLN